jgi:hypothetical protein
VPKPNPDAYVAITIPDDLAKRLRDGTDGPGDAALAVQFLREQLKLPRCTVLFVEPSCVAQLLYELRRGHTLEALKLVSRNLLPDWDAGLPASARPVEDDE